MDEEDPAEEDPEDAGDEQEPAGPSTAPAGSSTAPAAGPSTAPAAGPSTDTPNPEDLLQAMHAVLETAATVLVRMISGWLFVVV